MKILIIRFSSIGDIVLTTPVVRCIKEQLGAEVHYITKDSFASLLESNPHVDKVFGINKKTNPLKKVLTQLKKEHYDYILDLHKNWRSLQIKFALPAQAYTFDKLNFKKWLLTFFKINQLPPIHIVQRYLATTKKLGVTNDEKGLDYFIPSADYLACNEAHQDLHFHQYLCFVIGAAHYTKRLPTEKIIAVCKALQIPIVLIGGKDEKEAGKIIAQKAGKHIINLCGQLNLHQSAAIVDQSKLVIAHDTGFMHIAAALQKKIISIWGNTVLDFGMYP